MKKTKIYLDWKEIQPSAIDAINGLLAAHGLKLVDCPNKEFVDEYHITVVRLKKAR